MAKKQTRRSISVSKGTYERLKAFCDVNSISMSKFIEERVGDYLGRASRPIRSDDADDESQRPSAAIFTF